MPGMSIRRSLRTLSGGGEGDDGYPRGQDGCHLREVYREDDAHVGVARGDERTDHPEQHPVAEHDGDRGGDGPKDEALDGKDADATPSVPPSLYLGEDVTATPLCHSPLASTRPFALPSR